MMMIAVHDVYKLLSPFAVGHPMKCKPVHQVFKKGPKKHTAKKSECNPDNRIIKPGIDQIKKINNYRYIHPPNYQRMRFGHHLQILIPKQLSLTFIMYFLEFHFTNELVVKNTNYIDISRPLLIVM